MTKETRVPLPMEPGQPEKYDHEYERNGTANHFLFTEPLVVGQFDFSFLFGWLISGSKSTISSMLHL